MWEGFLVFDPTELPILTTYALYIPIFIAWMIKARDESILRRIIVPAVAVIGSAFMIFATILAHGITCIWYLIVFVVVMFIGIMLKNPKEKN